MLIEISRALTRMLRRSDVMARIGGDEFAIILKNVDDAMALRLAEDYRTMLNGLCVRHKQKAYHVQASLGLSMMDAETQTAGDLMANADIACNIAKRMGRNQSHMYEASSDERNAMGSELGWY